MSDEDNTSSELLRYHPEVEMREPSEDELLLKKLEEALAGEPTDWQGCLKDLRRQVVARLQGRQETRLRGSL